MDILKSPGRREQARLSAQEPANSSRAQRYPSDRGTGRGRNGR